MNNMSISLSMKALEPLLNEALEKNCSFTLIPRGTSMLPLIREGKDSVILSPLPYTVNVGDIILYKRTNGQFVLHRVMKAKNGSFTMCGDNQVVFEKGITRQNMIALASGIIRDDEEITFSENEDYLAYTKKLLSDKKKQNMIFLFKHYIKKSLKILKLIK